MASRGLAQLLRGLARVGGGGRPGGPRGLALLAQDLERLGRGRRLGDPPRRPLAHPEHAAVDDDLDPELLLVVGTHGLEDPVDGPVARDPLRVLLQAALGALERGDRGVRRQLLGRPPLDPVPGRVPAEVEVDRADERLERGREERRPDPSAALRLALAQEQERARGRGGWRGARARAC